MDGAGNPWESLGQRNTYHGDRKDEEEGSAAAPTLWHGRPVPGEPLDWSGSTSGDFKPVLLTPAQFDCLMSLRYRREVVVVAPGGSAGFGPVGDAIGYLQVTIRSLLNNGFIRARPGGSYSITDNGLHALKVCRVQDKTGRS
jgi:hypothetical protein